MSPRKQRALPDGPDGIKDELDLGEDIGGADGGPETEAGEDSEESGAVPDDRPRDWRL